MDINDRQEKALKYLLNNGKLNVNEYQKAASCIRRTAQRDLAELENKGIIRPVAKSKTDPKKYY